MEGKADNQDNCDNYIEFDQFSTADLYLWAQAYQFEAAFFVVFVPQIEHQTHHWYYLINHQIIIKAFWNVFCKVDVVQEVWIFGQFVHFWFTYIQAQH
jgi:hypothetical protein